MKHLVSQPHAILSVENPKYQGREMISHEDALSLLNQGGRNNAISMQGHYGAPERSILVSNPTGEQLDLVRKIAHSTGQESHIESNGKQHKMLYSNGPEAGKVVTGSGTSFHQTTPEDYYSVLPDGSTFTHNFDFDKSENLNKNITNKTVARHWHQSAYPGEEHTKDQAEYFGDMLSPHHEGSWEKKKIKVSDLEGHHSGHDASERDIAHFAEQRKKGSEFPAIIAKPHPEKPGKLITIDGQHRVAAAKKIGQTHIDAYVPKQSSMKKDMMWSQGNYRLNRSELQKGLKGDWKKEGYTLKFHPPKVEMFNGKHDITSHRVTAHDSQGNRVGDYYFSEWPEASEHKGLLHVTFSGTDPDHQRKGLASAAYSMIEQKTGKKVHSFSGNRSADAKALWSQSGRAFGKALQKAREEAHMPPEQKRSVRQERQKFSQDPLEAKITTQPGVSVAGIEARRADPRVTENIAHGYIRTMSPAEHKERAKRYSVETYKRLKAQPKASLSISKSDDDGPTPLPLPDFFERHEGIIPKDHPDYPKAIEHITKEYKNNKQESNRLHDRYITGGGKYVKKPMEKGLKGDWKKEGYKIHQAQNTMNRKYPIRVVTYQAHDKDGNAAGHYHFVHDHKTDTLIPHTITTFKDHQRKGLASAAYAQAERDTGKKIARGKVQSDDAKSLWSQSDRPFGKSDKIPGGLAEGKKPSDFPKLKLRQGKKVEMEHTSDPEAENKEKFDPYWLKVGTDIEMEHTDDKKIAEKIAKDHLREHHLYYKMLQIMEEHLKGLK
jgi:GNAT superfamily N-acetyltransferase